MLKIENEKKEFKIKHLKWLKYYEKTRSRSTPCIMKSLEIKRIKKSPTKPLEFNFGRSSSFSSNNKQVMKPKIKKSRRSYSLGADREEKKFVSK